MIRDDDGSPELTIHTPGAMDWCNPRLLNDAEMLTTLELPEDIVGNYRHSSRLVDDK